MFGGRSLLVVNCLLLELIALCIFLKYDQVESLRLRRELQEMELPKSVKKSQDVVALVTEESAKSKSAKDGIKSLTAPDRLDKTEIRLLCLQYHLMLI